MVLFNMEFFGVSESFQIRQKQNCSGFFVTYIKMERNSKYNFFKVSCFGQANEGGKL